MEDLSLHAFQWMDIEDFQMELIDFKASSLWTSKFVDFWNRWKRLKTSKKHFNMLEIFAREI